MASAGSKASFSSSELLGSSWCPTRGEMGVDQADTKVYFVTETRSKGAAMVGRVVSKTNGALGGGLHASSAGYCAVSTSHANHVDPCTTHGHASTMNHVMQGFAAALDFVSIDFQLSTPRVASATSSDVRPIVLFTSPTSANGGMGLLATAGCFERKVGITLTPINNPISKERGGTK